MGWVMTEWEIRLEKEFGIKSQPLHAKFCFHSPVIYLRDIWKTALLKSFLVAVYKNPPSFSQYLLNTCCVPGLLL